MVPRTPVTEHALEICKAVESLRQSRGLCDVVLASGDIRFPAHRLILAAASPVLKRNFSIRPNGRLVVSLPAVDHETLGLSIHYMYTGNCHLELGNVSGLLDVSSLLEINTLRNDCVLYIQQNVNQNNCVHFYELGITLSEKEVVQCAKRCLCSNLDTHNIADSMSYSNLMSVLASQRLRGDATNWLKIIISWLKQNSPPDNNCEGLLKNIIFESVDLIVLLEVQPLELMKSRHQSDVIKNAIRVQWMKQQTELLKLKEKADLA